MGKEEKSNQPYKVKSKEKILEAYKKDLVQLSPEALDKLKSYIIVSSEDPRLKSNMLISSEDSRLMSNLEEQLSPRASDRLCKLTPMQEYARQLGWQKPSEALPQPLRIKDPIKALVLQEDSKHPEDWFAESESARKIALADLVDNSEGITDFGYSQKELSMRCEKEKRINVLEKTPKVPRENIEIEIHESTKQLFEDMAKEAFELKEERVPMERVMRMTDMLPKGTSRFDRARIIEEAKELKCVSEPKKVLNEEKKFKVLECRIITTELRDEEGNPLAYLTTDEPYKIISLGSMNNEIYIVIGYCYVSDVKKSKVFINYIKHRDENTLDFEKYQFEENLFHILFEN